MLVECQVCGKKQDVIPSRARGYKTCSPACRGRYSSAKYSKAIIKECAVCGTDFTTKPSHVNRRKCCSIICANELKKSMYKGEGNPNYGNRGDKCPSWGGGEFINPYGYIMLFKPGHSMSTKAGYILEHRLAMSELLGRPLVKDEVVHHKDGNRLNNNIDNLEIMTRAEHSALHSKDLPRTKDGSLWTKN